ncbi:NADH dehydrogenase [ubiquinone] 1 alpha subcomplex assembly factor 3 [Alligator mississippiensis]|nr:NADH dehydrogenase [ubiquinone] 1 alpha subcomplex assembly factor 3 [Alligator mississippiensis]
MATAMALRAHGLWGRLSPRVVLGRAPCRAHGLIQTDDERLSRTFVSMLQREAGGRPLLEGCSAHGFTMAGARLVGPCMLLPATLLTWNVGSHRDITSESLLLFRLLMPRIQILVLGTGDRMELVDPAVLREMRQQGIAVEVQDTLNACATFNFLVSENRLVAAGLIPPPSVGRTLPFTLPSPARLPDRAAAGAGEGAPQ